MIKEIVEMEYQHRYRNDGDSPRYLLLSPDKKEELLKELIEEDMMKYQSTGRFMEKFREMRVMVVDETNFMDVAG